jgi:hypothetical protein
MGWITKAPSVPEQGLIKVGAGVTLAHGPPDEARRGSLSPHLPSECGLEKNAFVWQGAGGGDTSLVGKLEGEGSPSPLLTACFQWDPV